MRTLIHDVRYAVRMLIKNAGFSAVAILSLALGIGANTTIFTVVNAVLLNPLPVKDVARVVEVDTVDTKTRVTQARAEKLGMSYLNFQDYARQANDQFSAIACLVGPLGLTWSGGAEPRQLTGQLVSASYFDLLGLQPAVGRFFFPDEDKKPGGNNVVVLSHSLWTNKFGANPGVVGQTISLNATPYTVIGVAPHGFRGTFTFAPSEQVFIPVSMNPQVLAGFAKDNFNTRRFLATTVIARLKDGVTIGGAEASLKTIAAHLESAFPQDNAGRSVALTPLAEAAVGANNNGQLTLVGGFMMGVVGLVLLIACVNLANLLLAQAASREKEMGVRAAMGASRWRVIQQLLTESLVLAFISALVGLAIAYSGRSVLWSFRPPFIQNSDIDLSFDSRVLLFTITVALLTTILIGLAPALKASKSDLINILKIGGRGNTIGWTSNPFRSLLVVTEIALALVALVGAGLFIRSMQSAQNIDPGFESKNLFVFNFDLGAMHYDEGRGQQFFRAAIERAQSSPGVAAASISDAAPLLPGFLRTIFPEGQDEKTGFRGTLTLVDDISPNFFQTLRIPVVNGREFNEEDRATTKMVAIASEAMAKHFWPNEPPQNVVGKRFHFIGENDLREIVGIAKNTVVANIGEEPQPLVYLPLAQNYSPAVVMEVRTSSRPESVISTVRGQVQALDPNLALTNVLTVEELIGQGLWAPRMGAALLAVFGGLALLLAIIGVYGVLSYSVNQQTREIGIRMAMGAQTGRVLKLVVGQGMTLAGAGLLLGLIVAFVAMRVLSTLLYGVSAHDPITFISVSLILALAAAVACFIPARRATKVDPIIALRYE
jgi:predicted permease